MQIEPPVRPKDLASHSVGDIDSAVAIQRDNACAFQVEFGIMPGHNGIAQNGVFQLRNAFDAARNHGIRQQPPRLRQCVGKGIADIGEIGM